MNRYLRGLGYMPMRIFAAAVVVAVLVLPMHRGWGQAAPVDAYDVLFLQNEGAGTNFVDSSTANPKTVTAFGNAKQLQAMFNRTAGFFDGYSYVNIAHSTDFDFGTGDFSVEFYVNLSTIKTSNPGSDYFLQKGPQGDCEIHLEFGTLIATVAETAVTCSWSPNTNQWYKLAISRVAGVVSLYVDDVLKNTGNCPGDISRNEDLYLGTYSKQTTGTYNLNGWMKNLVVKKAGTTVLDMRFDSPAPSPLGPAMAFDGTGDYLSFPNEGAFDLGTNDFCIETFYFAPLNINDVNAYLFDGGVIDSKGIYINLEPHAMSDDLKIYFNGEAPKLTVSTLSSKGFRLGAWNHVAVQRAGGYLRAFINGREVGSVADVSAIVPNPSVNAAIFCQVGTGTGGSTGFLREYRFSNIARYTNSFTPSQTGFVLDGNTKLYIKGNEANGATAFTDATGKPVTTVGDTKIKYTEDYRSCIFKDETGKTPYPVGAAKVDFFAAAGTGSGFFGGAYNGDYLSVANNNDYDFGAGDFTIECMVRVNKKVSNYYPAAKYTGAGVGWIFGFAPDDGTKKIFLYSDGSTRTEVATDPWAVNTWYHLTVVRNGSAVRYFLNGTQVGASQTAAATYNGAASALTVGLDNGGGSWGLPGLMDNVRIAKGIARYTNTFNPAQAGPVAPQIVQIAPTNQAVMLGSNATITVTASGTEPMAFKWYRNGAPMDSTVVPSSTNSTLQLFNLQLSDAGTYYCVVTNDYGAMTSSVAMLTVDISQVAPGTKLWEFTPDVETLYGTPVIGSNGWVYFGSTGGKVYALDGLTAEVEWVVTLPSEIQNVALGDNGMLYATVVGGGVHALDAISGSNVWTQATPAQPRGPCVGFNGIIFIGDFSTGTLRALNATNGALVWQIALGSSIGCAPSVGYDQTVYVGTDAGSVFAVDGFTGQIKWQINVGGWVRTLASVDTDGTVFIGNGWQNSKIFAVDGTSGQIKWEFSHGHQIDERGATIGATRIYVGSYDNNYYCLDKSSGGLIWQFNAGVHAFASVIGSDGTNYFRTYWGKVYGIVETNGAMAWEFDAGASTTFGGLNLSPNGILYYTDKKFYAVKASAPPADTAWPMSGQNPQLTGRVRPISTNVPVVVAQPKNLAQTNGALARLGVVASGGFPMSYYWLKNGQPVPGSQLSVLNLTNVGVADAGHYTVVVSNSFGMVTSTVATVTVDGFLPPAGMSLIPAGSFNMGDPYAEGNSYELPVHAVFVSPFLMDRFEVTKGLWDAVMAWAVTNGYEFANAGVGQAPNHPVHSLNWYDAVKWCNARSEKEGLTPAYYTDGSQTTLYKTGQLPLTNGCVKWNANGYRLPTEAEWEKAARGGLEGHHFPWPSSGGAWSAHINGSKANYSGSGDPFEGNSVGTTPVGYYNGLQTPAGADMANGYGLYDMAGNVSEWCWDWWDEDWYGKPGATEHDSKGPADTASYRIVRGANWNYQDSSTRCANRSIDPAWVIPTYYGLRTVRGSASVPFAPQILAFAPTNASAVAGSAAQITVSAIGSEPLDYQWYRNGIAVPGAQSSLLSLMNVGLADAGGYQVVVTNAFGSVTSEVATVTVDGFLPPANYAWIPPGAFAMGSPDTEQDRHIAEGPQTLVTLTSGFWMAKHETRQWEYLDVTGVNPSAFTGDSNRPVEQVTWQDAVSYCAMLTARERQAGRIPTNHVFRLPTEAEWEYACRAGTTNRFFFGDDPGYTQLANYAWYSANSGGASHAAALKSANPWGLFDMYGNVWEWCFDWHGAYPGGSVTNPVRFVAAEPKVLRGGAWDYAGFNCRSATRGGNAPTTSWNQLGFRVVLTLGQAPSIVVQPQNMVIGAGTNTALSVSAGSFEGPGYHWYRNGALVPGSQFSVLNLTNVGLADAGHYTVVVSNEFGMATSSVAAVTVDGFLPPAGMSMIPAGAFSMGDALNDGHADELPVHTVTVGAFCLDQYEVTKGLWDEVYQWAVTNGYSFDAAGSGKAAGHPVYGNSWSDVVKWCNARSEKEGKAAAYFTDAGLTTVYRAGQMVPFVNWHAGYRLPTEAEWEKAARGGLAGQRFPWGSNITHNLANYQSGSYPYDTSSTSGFHPNYDDDPYPYTSPVGSFAPNAYGLYDMAGNNWEWCWDWYDGSYYGASPAVNPRGPATGPHHVIRGGSWWENPFFERVSCRWYYWPTWPDYIGFRTALPVPAAPVIVADVTNQVVSIGGSVSLSVTVEGTPELGYLWYRNGVTVPGAQFAVLNLTNVGISDVGRYQCVVTNAYGAVTSAVAKVSVGDGSANWAWGISAGGSGWDEAYDVALDGAGNLYVVGLFSGTATFGTTNLTGWGGVDIFLAKYAPSGQLQWVRGMGGPGVDYGYGVAVDRDGNPYISGSLNGSVNFCGTNVAPSGALLAKFNPNGELQWVQVDNTASDFVNRVAVDHDNNIYVAASQYGPATVGTFNLPFTGGVDGDAYLAKYSPSGNVLWAQNIGSTRSEHIMGLAFDGSNNVCIAGVFVGPVLTIGTTNLTNASEGTIDLLLAKLDPNGNVIWAKRDGIGGNEYMRNMTLAQDGGFLLVGNHNGGAQLGGVNLSIAGGDDLFLAKYDKDGNFQWVKSYGAGGGDYFSGITKDSAGNIYGVGMFDGSFNMDGVPLVSQGGWDGFLVKFNSNGTAQWAKTLSGGGHDQLQGVAVANSGAIYVGGFFDGAGTFGTNTLTGAGGREMFLGKVEANLYEPEPPVIVGQPQGLVVLAGASLNLSVSATGVEPIAYQWEKSVVSDQWAVVGGQTNSQWSVVSCQLSDAGEYRCVMSNEYGSVTSQVAVLTVAQGLVVGQTGSGRVEFAPTNYTVGSQVTLTAVPGPWYAFSQWGDGNMENPRMVTIGASNSYTAVFTNTVPLEWVVSEVHDPALEFSITAGNPNGNWSYGWMPPGFGAFSLCQNTLSNANGIYWTTDNSGSVWKNLGPVLGGAPTGWLSLHPGADTSPTILRWTAPAPGQVVVAGEFLEGDIGTIATAVRLDNQPWWGSGGAGVFNLVTQVVAGTTIDFAAYGGFSFGITPVGATISFARFETPVGSPVVSLNGEIAAGTNYTFYSTGAVQVALQSSLPGAYIFYTVDGGDPLVSGSEYTGVFGVSNAATIRAVAYDPQTLEPTLEGLPVSLEFIPAFYLATATNGQGAVQAALTSGQAVGGGAYVSNSVVQVAATPAAGWGFQGWSMGQESGVSSQESVMPVTVTSNITVTANFYPIPVYALNVASNGNGSVTATVVSGLATNSLPAGAHMAAIPAGTFAMGDSFNEGFAYELPVHSVSVSAFAMDKFEVTKALWDEVYQWATNHGYNFDNAGSGKSTNHPVQLVSWYDIVKWCNARSEKEGLVPAYYTETDQISVYRTGQVSLQNDWVKWNAGYRLPTEAEWEKAAQGGASGRRFSWGDTISHDQANYWAGSAYAHDLSYPAGYHPTYATGENPYTSPVGSFPANGYGLYDMSGNVWEYCWDWHETTYYASSSAADPRGPASGLGRALRGSSWFDFAIDARTARRSYYIPTNLRNDIGFRTVFPGLSGYLSNSLVSLTAVPAPGWEFAGWQVGQGAVVSNQGSVMPVTVDSNLTVTAMFTEIPAYTVAVTTPGGGTVQVSGVSAQEAAGNGQTSVISGQYVSEQYLRDTVVTVTATPGAGWQFVGWAGALSGTQTQQVVTVTSNFAAQAVFGTVITTATNGVGTVEIDPALAVYPYGQAVHLMGLPAAGKFFNYWTGPLGSNTLSPLRYVVTNATPSFTASFGSLFPNRFALTLKVIGDGEVARVPLTNQYVSNTVVTVSAAPNAGQVFNGWAGDTNGAVIAGTNLTVTMNASRVITASFAPGVPPQIAQIAPASQMVVTGAAVNVGVSVTGTQPLYYQWQKAEVSSQWSVVSGQTNSQWSVVSSQLSDAGEYRCVVTNAFGAATSAVATVMVTTNSFDIGMVAYYPFNGNANDESGNGNNGTVRGNVTWTLQGAYGSAAHFDGSNAMVYVPDSSTLHPTNVTVTAWVKVSANPTMSQIVAGKWYNNGDNTTPSFLLEIQPNSAATFLVYGASAQYAISADTYVALAGTYDGSVVRLFVNGLMVASTPTVRDIVGISPLVIGAHDTSGSPPILPLAGDIDEVRIYNRALSSNEVVSLYRAEAGGLLPQIAQITPISQTVMAGSNVTITVTASGTEPLSYQWQKAEVSNQWSVVSGQTNSQWSVVSSQLSDAAEYRCVVTNAYGAVTSEVATVSVVMVPELYSLSAYAAPVGSALTITGMGFSPVATNNYVWFGAVRATVTAATPSNLVVTVPAGATYVPVTVTVSGLTASFQRPFGISFLPQAFDAQTYASAFYLVPESGGNAVAAADFNGDGKIDLVTANSASTLSLFENQSTGGVLSQQVFSAGITLPAGGNHIAAVAADLDGDGKPDLATVRHTGMLTLYRNAHEAGVLTSNSLQGPVEISFAIYDTPDANDVAVADFDGDGRLDVAALDANNGVFVYRNVGSPGVLTSNSFAAPLFIGISGKPMGMAVADLDGDGKHDLALACRESGQLALLRNLSVSGTLGFAAPEHKSGGSRLMAIAAIDLDQDGKLDLAAADDIAHALLVYRNQGVAGSMTTNSFADPVPFPAQGGLMELQAGDLNGDTWPDLVLSSYDRPYVSMYLNQHQNGGIATNSLGAGLDYDAGYYQGRTVLADLNGDGAMEIISPVFSAARLAIQQGMQTMRPAVQLVTGTNIVVPAGDTVSISVTVGGSEPLFCQWQISGVGGQWSAVSNQAATLVLTNVQFSDAGSYVCVVTNAYGAVTSGVAVVTVTAVSPNTLALYTFEEEDGSPTVTNYATNAFHGVMLNGATRTNVPGMGKVLMLDGVDDYVSIDAALLNNRPQGTIEARVFLEGYGARGAIFVSKGNEGLCDIAFHTQPDGHISGTMGSGVYNLTGQKVVPTNVWVKVRFTWNGSDWRLFVDDVLDSVVSTTGYPTFSGNDFKIGRHNHSEGPFYSKFLMDDLRISSVAENEGKPGIVGQPQSQTAVVGGSAQISVSVAGTEPFYYQWQQNGTNRTDATNATLALANVQLSDAGSYQCVVSNAYGSVTSAVATVTVVDSPVITQQPQSASVFSGTNLALTAVVVGVQTLRYQWYRTVDGGEWLALVGATNATLSLGPLTLFDSATFQLVVSNSYGIITSEVAAVTVNALPWSGSGTAGVDWQLVTNNAPWPPRGDYAHAVFQGKMWLVGGISDPTVHRDVWSSADGINWQLVTNQTPWVPRWGSFLYAFNERLYLVGGCDNAGDYNDVWSSADGATWVLETANAGWAARRGSAGLVFDQKMWMFGGGSAGGAYFNDVWSSTDGRVWTQVTDAAGWSPRHLPRVVEHEGRMVLFGGGMVNTYYNDVWVSTNGANWSLLGNAAWSLRTGGGAASDGSRIWYLGGSSGYGERKQDVWFSQDGSSWSLATNPAPWAARFVPGCLVFNNRLWVLGGNNSSHQSMNDVWYTVLSTSVSPAFVAQPQSQTIGVGGTMTLAATVSGNEPLNYRWYKDASLVPGAQLSVLSLTNVQMADVGMYWCVAANDYGMATSEVATVLVTAEPLVTGNPQSRTNLAGTMAEFMVQAVGAETLGYQWEKDGSPVPGSQFAVLSLSNVQLSDAGSYRCVVTNSFGAATSAVATLTVVVPPQITQLTPTDQTVVIGAAGSISVTATGTETLSYQWQKETEVSGQWSVISGQTNSQWSVVSCQLSDAGSYRCVVMNAYGSVTSAVAVVTVVDTPTLQLATIGSGTAVADPTQAFYNLGQPVVLTATAARWYAFSQWQDGNTENPRTISINAINAYTAVFTNSVPLTNLPGMKWQRTFGGTAGDNVEDIIALPDGGAIFAGYSSSDTNETKSVPGFGGEDIWIVRVDAAGNKLWEKVYGGTGRDLLASMIQTADGGYIVASLSQSGASGNKATGNYGTWDAWIIKLDANGNKEWEKVYGGNNSDNPYGIVVARDGGYLVLCESWSVASGNKTSGRTGPTDGWVIRLNAQGDKLWEISLGGASYEYFNGGIELPDGSWLLAGLSVSEPSGNKTAPFYGGSTGDGWLVKLDANGNKLWDRSYGGAATDIFTGIEPAGDGGAVIAGYVEAGGPTAAKAWLLRVAENGDVVWEKRIGESGYSRVDCMTRDLAGNFVLGAVTDLPQGPSKSSPSYGQQDLWVLGYDLAGEKQYEVSYGSSETDSRLGGVSAGDGFIYIAGVTAAGTSGNKTSPSYGSDDYWIIKHSELIYPVGMPVVTVGGQPAVTVTNFTFPATGAVQVALSSSFAVPSIYYTLDGSDPFQFGQPYLGPMLVDSNVVVTAVAYDEQTFEFSLVSDPAVISFYPVYYLALGTNGNGTLTAAPAGQPWYTNGQVVTLTATPAAGWSFEAWSLEPGVWSNAVNGISGQAVQQQITISSNVAAVAKFYEIPVYGMTVWTAGGGVVQRTEVSGQGSVISNQYISEQYLSNAVATLAAVADPGWQFLYWTGGIAGVTATQTVTLSSNLVAEAVFGTAIATATSGTGTVQIDPALALYPYGTAVHMMGLPGSNRFFNYWSGTLGSNNLSPLRYVVTNAGPGFTAYFGTLGIQRYSLTVLSVGDGEVIKLPQAVQYTNGQLVTLTATPNPGWRFGGWSGDAGGTNPVANVTMNPHRTVTATFVKIPLPVITQQPEGLSLPVGASGTLTVAATGEGTLGYQWQKSVVSGQWSVVSGATNNQWQIANGQTSDSGNYRCVVSNGGGSVTSAVAVVTVYTVPLSVATTNPLLGGIVGLNYTQAVAAVGGQAPYAWSLAGGALPTGLAFSTNGIIHGTPAVAGSNVVTLRVTDSLGATAEREFTLRMTYAEEAITFDIGNATGPQGEVVNIPVRVHRFTNVSAFQFSMAWNPAVATFAGVEAFGLPGMTAANFGTNRIAEGILTMSWDDPGGSTQGLTNGAVMFGLNFLIVGAPGATSTVAMIEGPTAIEAVNQNMLPVQVAQTPGQIQVSALVMLSGRVLYYDQIKTVPGVQLNLVSAVPQAQNSQTDGAFSFGVSMGGHYSVAPTYVNDTNNAGVTTADIALIRRHILSVAPLDSPYKVLAADANGSGQVTTFDLTFMRRMILGYTNSLPAGNWRFVPSDHVFANPQEPWNAPTTRQYTGIGGHTAGQDFIGVRIGDVNNSWTPPAGLTGGRGASAQAGGDLATATFTIGQAQGRPGERVRVPVTVRGLGRATSLQFTLAWNAGALRYAAIVPGLLANVGADNFNSTRAGKLAFAWDDVGAKGVSVPDGAVLFTVEFEILTGALANNTVSLTDSPTLREAAADYLPVRFAQIDGAVNVVGAAMARLALGRDGWINLEAGPGVYILQTADNLTGPWTTLTSGTVASGVWSWRDENFGQRTARYYRVIQQK